MHISIVPFIQLLDHAPWLKAGHPNMLACVAETRERLITNQQDYDAWENLYGLIGRKDPDAGFKIATIMTALHRFRIEGWRNLVESTESLDLDQRAYRAARKLYRLDPSAHHAWLLSRAALNARKMRVAMSAGEKAFLLSHEADTLPNTAMMDTFVKLGLIGEDCFLIKHNYAKQRVSQQGDSHAK